MQNAGDFAANLLARLSDLGDRSIKFDNNYHECPMCFNSGFVETSRHDVIGRQYRGVTKCYSCGYWQRHAERLAKK